jgi:hypothetical protein
MKLDFLDDLTDGGKYPDADPAELVRIYEFEAEEVGLLIKSIQSVVIDKQEPLEVSALPFIHLLNCSLVFKISAADTGINPSPENKFVCLLSIETYRMMVNYMQPFRDNGESQRYNWLYNPGKNQIDLLFSADGSW